MFNTGACYLKLLADFFELIARHHFLHIVEVIHHLVHFLFSIINPVQQFRLFVLVVFSLFIKSIFLRQLSLRAWDPKASNERTSICLCCIGIKQNVATVLCFLFRNPGCGARDLPGLQLEHLDSSLLFVFWLLRLFERYKCHAVTLISILIILSVDLFELICSPLRYFLHDGCESWIPLPILTVDAAHEAGDIRQRGPCPS